jgi:hypothetical protein
MWLQRTCACGQHSGNGGECAACRQKRLGLQRQAADQAAPDTAPPIVGDVLRSPGQPLDANTRAFMEPRFGLDFSRVHANTNPTKPHVDMPEGAAARFAEPMPEWITTVRQHGSAADAKFPWRLQMTNVPCNCDVLRWEQFVSGSFTIDDGAGQSRTYDACASLRRINETSRPFGRWCDDILSNMRPGPRPVRSYQFASCSGGVTSTPNPSAMRGPSARLSGATYRFDDAPGFDKDFGETISGIFFDRISWSVGFVHKLWCPNADEPTQIASFSLQGQYRSDGTDTRRIVDLR